MTIEKKRHYLLYGNRTVIYVASLIGLYFDVNIAYVCVNLPSYLYTKKLIKDKKVFTFKHCT